MEIPTQPATRRFRRLFLVLALVVSPATLRAADPPPANDLLNAVLWMQHSVEYRANALASFTLAQLRLEQALVDRTWTAAPAEQTGAYQDLPPAVVVDLDETLLDNSAYQAWLIQHATTFDAKSWTAFVNAQISTAIPGAVAFANQIDAKGVKLFYITNRTIEEEPATRQTMTRLGFPMGGNVDTVLSVRKQPGWGSLKGSRRAFVAKDYRVLLNLGDNFGDFVDGYRGSEAERLKIFEDNRARWGREWIMLANPSYGSFESAPFGHDYKLPIDVQRAAKRDALQAWPGP
jgi:acid phosphatase